MNNVLQSALPLTIVVLAITLLYFCAIQYLNSQYREQSVRSHEMELERTITVMSDKLESSYLLWQQSFKYFAETGLIETAAGEFKPTQENVEVLPDTWAVLNKKGEVIVSNGEKITVPTNILDTVTDSTCSWTEFSIENNEPHQYFTCKIPNERGAEVYAILQIGPGQLSELIDEDLPYHVSIYNHDYRVIASDSEEEIGNAEITELTKKMLDGNTGKESSGGRKTAYGFSDTIAGPLYVTAWMDDTQVYSESNRFKTWSYLSIVPAVIVCMFIALWYRKMIISRETDQQRSRDVLHQESLLKRQDEFHLPLMQEISQGIGSVHSRLGTLTGGERMRLLVFYRDIAAEWGKEDGLTLNLERAEKKAFFDELNDMFTKSQIKHEKEIEVVLNQLRAMEERVTSHFQTGMNNELVDINLLIKDTVIWARKNMTLSGVELLFESEDIPAVLIHTVSFRKIMVGLLENALEASNKHQYNHLGNTPSRKISRSRSEFTKTKIQIYTRLEPQEIIIEMEDEAGGLDDKMRYQYFQENYSKSLQEHGFSLFRMDQYLKSINGKLKLRNTDLGLKATIRVPR